MTSQHTASRPSKLRYLTNQSAEPHILNRSHSSHNNNLANYKHQASHMAIEDNLDQLKKIEQIDNIKA